MSTTSGTSTVTPPSLPPSPRQLSNNSVPNRHQTEPLTTQQLDAHFASLAQDRMTYDPIANAHLESYDNNRARNNAPRKRLIPLFMEKFGMDARTAKATVGREMGEKYAANVWDVSETRKFPREQPKDHERLRKVEEVAEEQKGVEMGQSEDPWDVFERMYG